MISAGTIVAEARGFLRGLPPSGRVVVSVLESLGGNRYRLAFAGHRFTAKSSTPLTPGSRFRALVYAQNGRLELSRLGRPGPETPAGRPAPTQALAQNLAEGALAAAIRSRLPLRDTTLHILGRLSDDRRRGRTAASLIAKGFPEDEQVIERLSDLLVPPVGAGSGTGGRERQRSNDREERDESGFDGRGALRRYVERQTLRPGHPIQLYNHLRAKDLSDNHHWVVVPLGATMGTDRYDGALRICLDLKTGRTIRYSVEIQSGTGTTIVAHSDESGQVTIGGSMVSLYGNAMRELLRRLSKKGVSAQAAALSDEFDGFDTAEWRSKITGWSGTA